MKTLTLDDRTATLLARQAMERGLALEAYLTSLALLHAAQPSPIDASAAARSKELNVALDELFSGEPDQREIDLPDRREEIYADHD